MAWAMHTSLSASKLTGGPAQAQRGPGRSATRSPRNEYGLISKPALAMSLARQLFRKGERLSGGFLSQSDPAGAAVRPDTMKRRLFPEAVD